jgi:hypothetical protein
MKNKMKKNVRLLKKMFDIFGEDNFYICSVSKREISLQGLFNSKVLTTAKKYKFCIVDEPNGYIKLVRHNNIIIVLTD